MNIRKIFSKLCQVIDFEPTPGIKLPNKSEYLILYPDRLVHGKIACGCGSTKLKHFCAPVNMGPFFYRCQECGVVLFTTDFISRQHTEDSMKNIKLAVFDMEGTIFRNSYRGQSYPSIWKVLCQMCGPDAAKEDAINTEKYLSLELKSKDLLSNLSTQFWDNTILSPVFHFSGITLKDFQREIDFQMSFQMSSNDNEFYDYANWVVDVKDFRIVGVFREQL